MLQNWKDTNLILQQIYVNPAAGESASSPKANLHIGAGIAQVNGAPLMVDSGVLLTTPQNGAVETDGNHFYWTDNTGTRRQLDQQATSPSVPFTLTGTNAAAFAIGQNGATNPAFQVDTSESNQATGILVEGFSAGSGVNIEVLSSGTNEAMLLESKGSGGIKLNTTIGTGAVTVGTNLIVQGASSNGLSIGVNGVTNPVLNVDTSVASVATGLNIKGAAAAAGLAVAVISSGSNENLTLDAKGSGTITLNGIGTGAVIVGKSAGGLAGLQVVSNVAAAFLVGANGATNPVFQVDASTASVATGITVKGAAAAAGVNLNIISSGTNESLIINPKGTGGVSILSTNSNAFSVGANGTTNPSLQVDASTASAATGLKLKSAAAAAGVALSVISSGTNEGLSVTSKGTGAISFQPGSDVTTAFQVFRADATTIIFNVDTTNQRVGILKNNPGATLDINGTLSVGGANITTSASSNSLTVGRQGSTNPQFNVDSSVASVVNGINIKGNAANAGVDITTISSAGAEDLRISSLSSGNLFLNNVASNGYVQVGGSTSNAPLRVFSNSATALVVGANGATNPVLSVVANVGSVATGLSITGAATGGTTALAAIDSGANTNLTLDGKGTGTLGINTVSTTSGLVTIGNSVSLAGLKVQGATIQNHATAAINATATATAAQAATGYITSTSAAATTITLPTGTALGSQLGATQGTIFYLTIDNTAGANTVTIAVNTNAVLSADAVANGAQIGLLTIPSGVTGQGTFMLMFSSATAYTFSRIA